MPVKQNTNEWIADEGSSKEDIPDCMNNIIKCTAVGEKLLGTPFSYSHVLINFPKTVFLSLLLSF
jgi:hypothetical protein